MRNDGSEAEFLSGSETEAGEDTLEQVKQICRSEIHRYVSLNNPLVKEEPKSGMAGHLLTALGGIGIAKALAGNMDRIKSFLPTQLALQLPGGLSDAAPPSLSEPLLPTLEQPSTDAVEVS